MATDICSPSKPLNSFHHALGNFSLFFISFWNLKTWQRTEQLLLQPELIWKVVLCVFVGKRGFAIKINVLLKQWFKLMFSKVAKCSVTICLTWKEWISKGHSRCPRISSCHWFLKYEAGKWLKSKAVWLLGYSHYAWKSFTPKDST